MRCRLWVNVAAIAVAVSAGCKKDSGGSSDKPAPANEKGETTAPETKPAATWYRAVISDAEGASIPFLLEVPDPKSNEPAAAYGHSGRIELGTSWKGDTVHLVFGIFEIDVVAERAADKSLSGTWKKTMPPWNTGDLTFKATPIAGRDAPLFEVEGPPVPADQVTGIWQLELDESGKARLEVTAEGDGLRGLVSFPDGNRVGLTGIARGGKLMLSTFEGAGGLLLEGTVANDSFEGRWVAGAGLKWKEAVKGKRTDFELPSSVKLAKNPTLDYEQIGAGDYKGKPLIVELAGSWCSVCKRASSFLIELHEANKDRGLQMLTLTYEFTDDSEYNKARAELFKKTYKLPWEVRAMDGDFEDYWKIIPNAITEVNPAGFPVALFVAPSGEVIDIHAGFPPKGTRDHAEAIARYKANVDKLVAK